MVQPGVAGPVGGRRNVSNGNWVVVECINKALGYSVSFLCSPHQTMALGRQQNLGFSLFLSMAPPVRSLPKEKAVACLGVVAGGVSHMVISWQAWPWGQKAKEGGRLPTTGQV